MPRYSPVAATTGELAPYMAWKAAPSSTPIPMPVNTRLVKETCWACMRNSRKQAARAADRFSSRGKFMVFLGIGVFAF